VSFTGYIFDLNNPEGASVSVNPLNEKNLENIFFDFDKHLSISIKSSLSEEITSYISKNILDSLGIKKINKVDVDYFYMPF
ncbi:XRE family transcriptional regulator, partial [Lactococcus lactis]